jgi:hypothetical protein
VSKSTRDQATKTAQLAEPFRQLLKTLLRERVRTEAEKRTLAAFLDRSVSFVNQLVYHGEGGLDAWVGAFVYAYGLDIESLVHFFRHHTQTLRRLSPQTPADKIWFELDREITADEKFYWASLVRAGVALDRELGIQRQPASTRPASGARKRAAAAEPRPRPRAKT